MLPMYKKVLLCLLVIIVVGSTIIFCTIGLGWTIVNTWIGNKAIPPLNPTNGQTISTSTTQEIINPQAAARGFVVRKGTQLLLNGVPFRFAGVNMHWLPFGDSPLDTSQFQINDGLAAAKEMGLTVVRSHNLGVSTGCGICIEPSLGIFSQKALAQDDYVIQAAHKYGIRLIIPLTDNYHYYAGGKHNFTDWRGISDENQFYTNPQVIWDFEQYINALLNHVNIYTGIAYKNDPTIMAWETGNELHPTDSWTLTISDYIKSVDANHLIIDGSEQVNPNATLISNIDIVSNHYYPKSIARLNQDAALARQNGKVFIVGEFDWNDANRGDSLGRFLAAVVANPEVSGDAFWELWPHDDHYGYVSAEIKYMLHYPGDTPEMRTATQLLRAYAYKMRGLAIPPASTPGTPVIDTVLRNTQQITLTWQGTAIAASYTIERATVSSDGPWSVICNQCANDTTLPWIDRTLPAGNFWYRVTAYNLAGKAGSSSPAYQVDPALTPADSIVDDLNDWSKVNNHSASLFFDRTHAEMMGGNPSRVSRGQATHEWISWGQSNIFMVQMVSYFWPYEAVSPFSLYTSADNVTWILATPEIAMLYQGTGNWPQYTYTLRDLSNTNFVKVVWNNTNGHAWSPELGQVIIGYG